MVSLVVSTTVGFYIVEMSSWRKMPGATTVHASFRANLQIYLLLTVPILWTKAKMLFGQQIAQTFVLPLATLKTPIVIVARGLVSANLAF